MSSDMKEEMMSELVVEQLQKKNPKFWEGSWLTKGPQGQGG